MFDVGFSEMLVIGIVALVVIGPERLPKVARTLGHLMGRAQRYVNDVKRDIDREMQIDELRKLQAEMQDAARSIESSVTTQVGEVKSELDKAQNTLNQFAEQTSDLTRLDDPLAAKTDVQAASTEAGMDGTQMHADVVTDQAGGPMQAPADAQSGELAQQPQAQSQQPWAQATAVPNEPLGGPVGEPVNQPPGEMSNQPSGDPANTGTNQQVTEPAQEEPEPELLRHQVDHIVPDYSEGVMGPNTSINQPAPGAAGVAVRNVLVHVDLPPVT